MSLIQAVLSSYGGVVAPVVGAIVAGAGTSAANGTYTERGTFHAFPYYNLVGHADDPTKYSIAQGLFDNLFYITDSAGNPLYQDDGTSGEFPWEGAWSQVFAQFTVINAGSADVNDTYNPDGTSGGKTTYTGINNSDVISWSGTFWQIVDPFSVVLYTSDDAVTWPWQVTTWSNTAHGAAGVLPLPTATVIGAQSEAPVPTVTEA